LEYIAATNKQHLPATAEDTLRQFAAQSDNTAYGPANFLSSARLAKNTVLLVVCW
jgi:hypothetical protein